MNRALCVVFLLVASGQHLYCRGAPPPRTLAASLRSRLTSGDSLL